VTQSSQILVSAFDLHHANKEEQNDLRSLLKEAADAGVTVLMDSGKYESYWKEKCESWSQDDFHNALSCFECSFAFGYDEQVPPVNFDAHVSLICDRHKLDQSVVTEKPIVPIIHGAPDSLPRLCAKISDLTGAEMIAVPERRLGNGVFARSRCVSEIRCALNATGRYVGLHLLGTGNPISLAIYSLAGADSFDGLEWCRTVVDYETGFLFHFSQADFFKTQTRWGESDIGFQARTLAHNLEFYNIWMSRLRENIRANKGRDFCKIHFPPQIYAKCTNDLGWEDKE
jgi:hypothetical protein